MTIRRAVAGDAEPLRVLAALDEEPELAGGALLAEVEGELWAAVALADGRVLADPFRPTRGVRDLLELRRRELLGAGSRPRRLRLLGHRLAA
ncbi:MAG TPA: hypothetical protein VFJ91_10015 [Gaiellaceae bacterium]|nr:hypothetical protein [Gaiellaceae bacterium]